MLFHIMLKSHADRHVHIDDVVEAETREQLIIPIANYISSNTGLPSAGESEDPQTAYDVEAGDLISTIIYLKSLLTRAYQMKEDCEAKGSKTLDALNFAVDVMDEMRGYVPDYFAGKHNIDRDIHSIKSYVKILGPS